MVEISGEVGELRVGYQLMATVRNWRAVHKPESLDDSTRLRLTFTGVASEVDPFWSTHAPTSLWLWMGEMWWKWDTTKTGLIKAGRVTFSIEGAPEIHA